MIAPWLVLIPLLGGMAAWASRRACECAPRWISLVALALVGVLLPWAASFERPWMPSIGASVSLRVDALSVMMLALAVVLGMLAVIGSWRIEKRPGFYHFCLMWLLAAMIGIVLAQDLLLFYFFWELMLAPLYLLIGIWGEGRRVRAALKTFIYTQAGGLLMLAAILGLHFQHAAQTQVRTFDFAALAAGPHPGGAGAMLLMLAMFAGLAVKLPVVGLHGWLCDAHACSPEGGGVDMAALVYKVGAYAMLRFLVPLFPEQTLDFATVGMAIGAAAIIYGAVMAFAQTHLKRMLAYSSVSHMGFVLMGVLARNDLAWGGAAVVIVASGITTGGLFAAAGMLHRRLGSYDIRQMGGLWRRWPRLGGTTMFLALATLGLPGLANFVGELLVLAGVFEVRAILAAVGALGLVLSAVYALRLVQRIFHGPSAEAAPAHEQADMSPLEGLAGAVCIVLTLAVGFYPQPIIRSAPQAPPRQTPPTVVHLEEGQ